APDPLQRRVDLRAELPAIAVAQAEPEGIAERERIVVRIALDQKGRGRYVHVELIHVVDRQRLHLGHEIGVECADPWIAEPVGPEQRAPGDVLEQVRQEAQRARRCRWALLLEAELIE